jgi:hypothetical protein
MGDACLFLNDELSVARDAGRKLGRERDCLVEGVRMQGLSTTKNCCQGFY